MSDCSAKKAAGHMKIDARASHGTNVKKLLPPELLERIGLQVDSLAGVRHWTEALALRHEQMTDKRTGGRDFVSMIPMIKQSIVEGEVHRTTYAYEEEDEEDYQEDDEDVSQCTLLHRAILQTFERNTAEKKSILRDIFLRFPAAMRCQDADGNTPLHVAMSCPLDPSVMRAFKTAKNYDFWNDVLQTRNKCYQTPLDVALVCNAHYDVAKKLIDREENVLTTVCCFFYTPIQELIINLNEYTNVKMFAKLRSKKDLLHPLDAITNVDQHGNTALHLLLLASQKPHLGALDISGLLAQLIDPEQDVLRMRTNFPRDTPLHMALRMALPLAIIRKLVDTEEAVLCIRNSTTSSPWLLNDTPLHLAIKGLRHINVIQNLIDTPARVLLVANGCGDTPMHTALRKQTLQGQDNAHDTEHGDHPNASVQANVVLFLMRAAIEHHLHYFLCRGEHGDTVLHCAIKSGAPFRVVKQLVQAESRMITMRNNRSVIWSDTQFDTPLHLALKLQRDYEQIQLMVHADPNVLRITNCKADTPLHVAIKYDASAETTQFLAEMDPSVLVVQNCMRANDDEHMCPADTPLSLAVKKRCGLDVVRLLVDEDAQVLRSIDFDGDTVLNVAYNEGMLEHVEFFEAILAPIFPPHSPDTITP